ncbi:MAG: hypothetical protein AABX29_02085 [Nanoarchaeota archaeon]
MAEAAYQDINPVLSDIINRIRTLESKYNLLGERLLIVNQNMLAQYKKNLPEFKAINSDIREIKSELFKLKEVIKDLAKEMQFFATKEDIKVLEKYINLWNPIKFITEEELDKILEEKLKTRGKNARSKK